MRTGWCCTASVSHLVFVMYVHVRIHIRMYAYTVRTCIMTLYLYIRTYAYVYVRTFCMYSVSKFYVEVGDTTVCCLALQGMLNFVRLQLPSSPTTAVLYGVFVVLIVSCCHNPACVWTYCTYKCVTRQPHSHAAESWL